MSARELAARLRALGVVVGKVVEGDDVQDGEICITADVSVQVPTFDGPSLVVRRTIDDAFCFYDERENITDLVADIRKASDEAATEQRGLPI